MEMKKRIETFWGFFLIVEIKRKQRKSILIFHQSHAETINNEKCFCQFFGISENQFSESKKE